MRSDYLVWALLIGCAQGQAAQRTVTNPSSVELASGDAVITIDGFCAEATGDSECKTVLTRAEFEKVAEALQPAMPQPLRLKVANAYAHNLRMAAAAEKRGLDKTSAFEEEMRFARMQLLAQDLTRALQEDANNISQADLEDYYKKNQASFEEATLARIFVPRAKQTAGTRENSEDAEEEMTKIAAELRARAASGEDPNKLQQEAYARAGFEATTVDTKMEKVRRAGLPPQHETVMDLKAGEVSQMFSDPSGAHFIYKMIGRETLTPEDVKDEIRSAISKQRYQESMKAFEGNVVFSDAYFNPQEATATTQTRRRQKEKKAVERD
jgi:hypothetical protein